MKNVKNQYLMLYVLYSFKSSILGYKKLKILILNRTTNSVYYIDKISIHFIFVYYYILFYFSIIRNDFAFRNGKIFVKN